MKRKVLPYIGYFSLLLIAGAVSTFLFWIYSPPEQAIIVSPNPIPIVNKTVSKDGFVILKYTSCKNVTAVGRIVITQIGNNVQLTFPVSKEKGDRECKNNQIPFPVHPLSIPGVYHIHFRATYQVNPITSITEDFDTESFTVK